MTDKAEAGVVASPKKPEVERLRVTYSADLGRVNAIRKQYWPKINDLTMAEYRDSLAPPAVVFSARVSDRIVGFASLKPGNALVNTAYEIEEVLVDTKRSMSDFIAIHLLLIRAAIDSIPPGNSIDVGVDMYWPRMQNNLHRMKFRQRKVILLRHTK